MRGRIKLKLKLKREDTQIHRIAAAKCSAQTVQQVRQHRLSLTVAEQERVVEVAPDGSRKVLKELPASRLGLAKGTILTYR